MIPLKAECKGGNGLTVKERNKLHSEGSCFVLLPAPLHSTQLLPERRKNTLEFIVMPLHIYTT